ncbi:MAG: alpha/beta hydrolase family protein [Cyanobacteriota bacterium]
MEPVVPRLSLRRAAVAGLALAAGGAVGRVRGGRPAVGAAGGTRWLGSAAVGPEPGTWRLSARLGEDWADVYLPVAAKRRPVALVLQGANVDKGHYATFAALLARHGFVVVVPNHWRTSPPLPLVGRRMLLADQRQIPAALAALEQLNGTAPPPLRGEIDIQRLVVVGHSMGGLAGVEALANRCRFPLCMGTFARPKELRGGVFVGTDLRGHGGVAVAPIDTNGLPVALIRGSRDGVSKAEDVEATWRQLRTPRRALLTIKGANHFALTTSGQPVNPPGLPPIHPDPNPATVPQRETLERIARWSGAFLREAVGEGR